MFGASIMQDRDLSEYNPSLSNTSKNLPCSHHLCKLGTNCKGPKEPCPYIVDYSSENTSTSGFLVEDKLHLASVSDHATKNHVQASVILGWVCLSSFVSAAVIIIIITIFFWTGMCSRFLSDTCYVSLFFFLVSNFIKAAVAGYKVVAIWMELLLMVLWDWDLGTFQFQVCLQKLD